MIKSLNESNFDNTILSNDLVLVDFSADWCGPCRVFQPILENVAESYEGKALVSKVNVDTSPELTQQYGVRSIPALFYFHKGELIEKTTGIQSKSKIAKSIDKLLA